MGHDKTEQKILFEKTGTENRDQQKLQKIPKIGPLFHKLILKTDFFGHGHAHYYMHIYFFLDINRVVLLLFKT